VALEFLTGARLGAATERPGTMCDPDFARWSQLCTVESAVRDRRVEVALSAAGYGLTQTLAATPQMVARWENARTAAPYAWAVLTAALDAGPVRFRTRCRVSESLAEKLLKHGG
jgi:hypothetical protein